MHDKRLCPTFKLIHIPDVRAVLFQLWLMLSPLLEDKKRDSLHCIKQYITKYFLEYTALAVRYRAAVL